MTAKEPEKDDLDLALDAAFAKVEKEAAEAFAAKKAKEQAEAQAEQAQSEAEAATQRAEREAAEAASAWADEQMANELARAAKAAAEAAAANAERELADVEKAKQEQEALAAIAKVSGNGPDFDPNETVPPGTVVPILLNVPPPADEEEPDIPIPQKVLTTDPDAISTLSGPPIPAAPLASQVTSEALEDARTWWRQQLESGLQKLSEDKTESDVDAYSTLEQALRVAWEIFPSTDMRIVQNLMPLAIAAKKLRLFQVAEQLYDSAESIAISQPRRSATDLALIKAQAACCYAEQDKFQVAERTYVEALGLNADLSDAVLEQLAIVNATLEQMRVRAKAVRQSLELMKQAESSGRQGQYQDADELYNKAFVAIRNAYNRYHTTMPDLLDRRSAIVRKLGDTAEAKKLEQMARKVETFISEDADRWEFITGDLYEPELRSRTGNPLPDE